MSEQSDFMTDAEAAELERLEKAATPAPWINASPSLRCVKPEHSGGHPGGLDCSYTFQGWSRGEYFGLFVSSEATLEEIIGSTDYGPMLCAKDALLIAAARNALPKLLAERRALVDELTQRVDAHDRDGRALLAARAELDRLRAENREMRAALEEEAVEWGRVSFAWSTGDSRSTDAIARGHRIRAILGRERRTET